MHQFPHVTSVSFNLCCPHITCCSLIEHDISYILFRTSIILSVHITPPLHYFSLQNYTKTVVNIHNGNVHRMLFYYFWTFKHCVKTITPIGVIGSRRCVLKIKAHFNLLRHHFYKFTRNLSNFPQWFWFKIL